MIQHNVDVILLTDSAFFMRTLGAYRIASEVRKNNYSCQVIDFFSQLPENDLLTAIDCCVGSNTKMLGISTTFASSLNPYQDFSQDIKLSYMRRVNSVLMHVKNKNPLIKIVVGGANALSLDHPAIDAIITGYADVAVIDYIKWLDNKNPWFTYDVDCNKIIVNGTPKNSNFDFAASQVIYADCDNIISGESLVLEVARGCIFKCLFCNYPLNGKKKNDYIKLKDTLSNELIKNYQEHGISRYILSDDTHNDNSVKLEMLADIKQNLPFELEYSAYIRLEILKAHPEQYSLLRDSGLVGAFFGIESLNYASSKSVGKGIRPEKIKEELYKFKDLLPCCGTAGSFIVGLPYDTPHTVTQWAGELLDESYPLDAIFIGPLTIDTSDKKVFKSEFDLNWQKYYTIDNKIWHNGFFDRVWAEKFCKQLTKEIETRERNRVGGFTDTVLKNLGLFPGPDKRLPASADFLLRSQKRLDQYTKALLGTRQIISC